MLKLAICDDSTLDIAMTEKVLEQISEFDLKWDVFYSGEKLLEYRKTNSTNEGDYDIYLLDIEMPGMNGIEVAKRIKEDDPRAIFIFLTSYTEYVFMALDVVFFSYLRKPLSKEDMLDALQKVAPYLDGGRTNITFKNGVNIHSVKYEDILYLERKNRNTFIYIINKEEPYKSTTRNCELMKQLDEKEFAPTHNSFCVNMRYVSTISKEQVIMIGGITIPISRQYKNAFRKSYLAYMKKVV